MGPISVISLDLRVVPALSYSAFGWAGDVTGRAQPQGPVNAYLVIKEYGGVGNDNIVPP